MVEAQVQYGVDSFELKTDAVRLDVPCAPS